MPTREQISLVAQTALISFNVSIGYGQHIWDFNPKDLQTFLLMSNSSGFFSILAAMLSKTSFAITVLRISEGWTRRFVWFIIITINATLGFAALATYVQCTPTEKLWRPMLQGTCWPKEFIIDYNIFTAAYSGAMDIVLALLPWRIIWKLTINKKEKLGVMVAMSMGILFVFYSPAHVTSRLCFTHANNSPIATAPARYRSPRSNSSLPSTNPTSSTASGSRFSAPPRPQ